MKLYFTRHGKTEWNQARRFQGMNGDSPLLPTSYEQIYLLGQHLKEIPFEAIYSSPSKRARDTTLGIQRELLHPTEIIYNDDLREMGYGELEGQSIDEMYAKYREDLTNLRHHLDRYDPSAFKGETTEAMLQRVSKVIFEAVTLHEGPLLFVGHGASFTATLQHLVGKDTSELRAMGGLLNNSLTILETENKQSPYQMCQWNDVSFLA
jgi:probable phosphoglycerate mutase